MYFFRLLSATFEVCEWNKSHWNALKLCLFQLIVFFMVHFIEFVDNKVCHANGVSSRNTQDITIYIIFFYRGILKAKQAQQQQHHRKIVVVVNVRNIEKEMKFKQIKKKCVGK